MGRDHGSTHVTRRHPYPSGGRHRPCWVAAEGCSRNPLDVVESLAAPTTDPQPPTPTEAARILEEASKDPERGALVRTAMTMGARRGELCVLWREDLDLDDDSAEIFRNHLGGKVWQRRG